MHKSNTLLIKAAFNHSYSGKISNSHYYTPFRNNTLPTLSKRNYHTNVELTPTGNQRRNYYVLRTKLNNNNKSDIMSMVSQRQKSDDRKYYAFNLDRYNSMLTTKSLGRPCIYLDVVDSTVNLANQQAENTIVLAKTQTNGMGQRNNQWTSPPGCAMASMKMQCRQDSFVGKRISFLQHLVALAIVRTLEDTCKQYLGKQYIRLKWPNDIYYVDELGKRCKIGGILIKTTIEENRYIIITSFGLNVFNSEPTTCINDILAHFESDVKVEIDELVAKIVNRLEDMITNFTEDTLPDIKQDYMSRWIHTRQQVDDDKQGRVEIVGVDSDGFLLAKRISDGVYCQLTSLNMTPC